MNRKDGEDALFAFGLGVDARDELVAEQNGQTETSPAAFGFGYEDFEAVFEVEEALRALAEPDQGIEGREDAEFFGRFAGFAGLLRR